MRKLTNENSTGNTVQEYHAEDSLVNQESFPNSTTRFKVTITEKLQKIVMVKAVSRVEAEQIVSDNWKNSEYILDAENFVDVAFEVVPASGQDD